jgi:hypothetical protein
MGSPLKQPRGTVRRTISARRARPPCSMTALSPSDCALWRRRCVSRSASVSTRDRHRERLPREWARVDTRCVQPQQAQPARWGRIIVPACHRDATEPSPACTHVRLSPLAWRNSLPEAPLCCSRTQLSLAAVLRHRGWASTCPSIDTRRRSYWRILANAALYRCHLNQPAR